MDLGSKPITRRSLPAIVAGIVIGALVITPAVGLAGKFLTKKKALKLFYTKSVADQRFVNVGPEAAALKTNAVEANNNPADIDLAGAFTDVISASITVPGTGQLIAEASAGLLGVASGSGGCRFKLGSTPFGLEMSASVDNNMPIPLLARTSVGAGAHTVTIECREGGGTLRYTQGTMVLLFVPD